MAYKHTNTGGGTMSILDSKGDRHVLNSGSSVVLEEKLNVSYIKVEQVEEQPRRVKSVKKVKNTEDE